MNDNGFTCISIYFLSINAPCKHDPGLMDSYFYPRSLTSDCPDKRDPFEKKGWSRGWGCRGPWEIERVLRRVHTLA